MPQLHLYVSEEEATAVKARAEESGKSLSAYLADLVRREVTEDWPEGFFERVAGGWKGEKLRRAAQGRLERREEL